MNIISEQNITDAEAKDILEAREKEGEMKYEQNNAVEVLRKFATYPSDKVKVLVAELMKIEKLRDKQIITIANILPEDKDDLRAILQKEYTNFTEDETNLILETVRKI
ncbi:DNA-directed RNA polymerase subunit F [archaeon]|nr:MAG: DNA-directed RNA polymerase subunit F [archaeon]